jgi:hypothetical protein
MLFPEPKYSRPCRLLLDNLKMGDVIYLLPVIKHFASIYPAEVFIQPWKGYDKAGVALWQDFFPLLRAQKYIVCADYWDNQPVDRNLMQWRAQWRENYRWFNKLPDPERISQQAFQRLNLTYTMLRSFSLSYQQYADTPWLAVEPRKESSVVVARSFNYRNVSFCWDFLQQYDAQFVGTPEEYEDFSSIVKIPYRPVGDCLEMAQLIAGCDLFVGNQSLPYAIAEALKVRTVQETDGNVPDCIFKRKNADYFINTMMGGSVLDANYESRKLFDFHRISPSSLDENMWRFYGVRRSGNHALIDWLLDHSDAPRRHYNNVDIRQDGMLWMLQDQVDFRPGDLLQQTWELISFEDCDLEKDSILPPCKTKVLLLRNPLNVIASRLKRSLRNAREGNPERLGPIQEAVKLWKQHAKEFLGHTNYLGNFVGILYDCWLQSAEYRSSVAASLSLDFTDKGFGSSYGHKFSFGSDFDTSAYLERYKEYQGDLEFVGCLDDELQELTKAIFGTWL